VTPEEQRHVEWQAKRVEINDQIDAGAKKLTLAFEMLRRSIHNSAAFLFSNRERTGPAPWAMSAMQRPDRPDPAEPQVSVPKASDEAPIPLREPAKPPPARAGETEPAQRPAPTPPPTFNIGAPELPPIPLAPDRPPASPPPPPSTFGFKPGDEPAWNIKGGAFGLGTPKPPETTSATPAFDRPQNVIITGPNPLPVSIVGSGAFQQPATDPREKRESKSENGLMKALARQFMAVLGPLYALNTILGQTNSGMGVFQKSVNVLGAVIAPIVLPAFVMLAAGILAVSDMLWSKLLPALGKFYEWALKVGLPGVEDKTSGAEDAVDAGIALKNFVTKGDLPKMADMPRMLDGVARNIDPTPMTGMVMDNLGGGKDLTNWLSKQWGSMTGGNYKDFNGMAKAGGWQGSDKAGKDDKNADGTAKVPMGQRVSDAMRDVIKSLGMSMGPKGGFGGLTEKYIETQNAAMNQDPIEARQLKVMEQTLTEMQKAVAALEKDDLKPNAQRSDTARRT
jgi:hypothetical protein